MDKRDYFIAACQAGAYRHRHWLLQMFTTFVFDQDQQNKQDYPFKIQSIVDQKDGYYSFDIPGDTAGVVIKDSVKERSIFRFEDRLLLSKGDIPNLNDNITTTYGNLLFNWIVLVYPFGDKVPYMNTAIKGRKIDSLIASRLVDTPPEGVERDNAKIYVDEVERYMEGMTAVGSLAIICAPAASPKTMSIDKAVLKRRDELFRDAGDSIKDPAILAKIEEELTSMDKESFKGDTSEKFYIKDKTINVSRKACFISVGAQPGFEVSKDGLPVVAKPLSEGWDLQKFPALIDELRSKSYKRGADTALGGESVKYFYRVFQNTTVAEEDCGVTEGLSWQVDETNYTSFIGLYMMVNKKTIEITEDVAKASINKTIYTRSPLLCVAQAPSFCAKCVGKALAESPTGLHIAASSVGSAFMSASLAAAHGKAIRTEQFQFTKQIT